MTTQREPLRWRVTQSHMTGAGNMFFHMHGPGNRDVSVYVTPSMRWHYVKDEDVRLLTHHYQAIKIAIAEHVIRRDFGVRGA